MIQKIIGADGIILLGKSASGGVGVAIGDMYYIATEEHGMKALVFKYQ